MRRAAKGVPAWAWLGAIVVASSIVRFLFARHMVAPWIMIDELVYSELAKSFAATGHFAVRGVPTSGYGVVYPVLISPAYKLFRTIPDVYTGIKAINSVLMSLAAVPAYLLARRVVSPTSSLVVAVLTVAVPSTFYAGTIMTENAFYPLFLLTALALVIALERPTAWTVVVFLLALGLAYETRAQAVAMAPAALTAPVLLAAFSLRPRQLLRYGWLYGLLLGVGGLVVGGELARGRSVRSLLGAYAAATHSGYDPGLVAHWLLWHVGELDLYVGAIPVLALVILVGQAPRLAIEERAFVAAALSLVAWMAVEVAAFASQPSVARIEERNLFYVAPLLFICLAIWIERGAPRPWVATALGAVAAAGLVAVVPYDRFITTSAVSDTFAMLPLWSLSNWLSIPLGNYRWILLIGAAVFVVVALAVPRRAAFALPVLVLLLYIGAAEPIDARTQRASVGALFQGITSANRDWVTAAVGTGDPTKVAVVWTGGANNMPDALVVLENEFFNRDVGAIYTTAGAVPGGLAQTPIRFDQKTGYYLAAGRKVRVQDLLTDTSLPVTGRLIAEDARRGMELIRVDGVLRSPYVVTGIYPDEWSGSRIVYRRFTCTPGDVLAVSLQSDPKLLRRSQVVRAYVRGLQVGEVGVAPGKTETFHVALQRGQGGRCVVTFRIPHPVVPADVEQGSTDTRALGIRVLGFSVGGRP